MAHIEKGVTNFLRLNNAFRCSLCTAGADRFPSKNALVEHLRQQHEDQPEEAEKAIALIVDTPRSTSTAAKRSATDAGGPAGAGAPANATPPDPSDGSSEKSRKKLKSPTPSTPDLTREGDAAGEQATQRSRARLPRSRDDSSSGFAPPRGKGYLWQPGIPALPRRAANPMNRAGGSSLRAQPNFGRLQARLNTHPPHSAVTFHSHDEPVLPMLRQPETRPISQDQIIAEVKGIYSGLVMVESKCIEVDNTQNALNDTGARLNDEQWQALIALHRTLLHEHHDFFLASQHPSASPALRRLASKYAMPARMWRHGIHSFLELLRHRLPYSLEHMLAFIYLAYSMMALLYETVPSFEDTWIECLGDLGRYRMAIEEEDMKDKEIWTSVSRHWYSLASDKAPTTGRLYHHLAILARPNAVMQLFFYVKSLSVAVPFGSARESILTLLDPILTGCHARISRVDLFFVKAHAILFTGKASDAFNETVAEFLDPLDDHIARQTKAWMEPGHCIAVINSCAMLGYGSESNELMQLQRPAYGDETGDAAMIDDEEEIIARANAAAREITPSEVFTRAQMFAVSTDDVVLRRFGDTSCFPYVHVRLVFMLWIARLAGAMVLVEATFPWKLLALFLNSLMNGYTSYERIESEDFCKPAKGEGRPLPEDWALRGLLWSEHLFPRDWFRSDRFDDDERYFEIASMTGDRRERILWLGCRLATVTKAICYNSQTHRFSPAQDYDIEIDVDTELDFDSNAEMSEGQGVGALEEDLDTIMSSPTIVE